MMVVFCVLALGCIAGCAAIEEDAKLLWGSSTQALEDARNESLKETFSCPAQECFLSVIKFAEVQTPQISDDKLNVSKMNQPAKASDQKTVKVKNFEVFLRDSSRNIIVLMGVPGSVNTTEVGVFFTPLENAKTAVEISSLSTSAKIKAADMIFEQLGKEFQVIK